jgi:hypothetical protein
VRPLTTRRTLALIAGLATAAAAAPTVRAHQPEPAEAPGSPAAQANDEAPMPSRDAMLERLTDRLETLDALRERLASIKSGLEAGEPIDGLLDPEDRWLLARQRRGLGGVEGFLPGGAGPEAGPPGGPRSGPRGTPPEDAQRGGFGERDRGGDRPGFSPREPMSDEDLARVRAIIDEHVPQVADRLRVAEQDDPEAAGRFLARIAPRFRDLLTLEREAPELVPVRVEELRTGMEIVNAARELRRLGGADSDAYETKKTEIRGLLERQYDLRHRLEEHRLSKMEADLRSARAKLSEQAEDRDRVIDEHLERVLRRTLQGDRDRDRETEGRRRRPRD